MHRRSKLEFYSFVHFVLFFGSCSFMAEEVENTGKHNIDNGEAWERYV